VLHSAETELLCVGLSDVEQSLELNRAVCSVVKRVVRDVPRTRNPLVELLVFFFSDLKRCVKHKSSNACEWVSGWVANGSVAAVRARVAANTVGMCECSCGVDPCMRVQG
jgi:hypothetical protein